MSSTKRGGERHPGDFYRTPEWCTELILPRLPQGGIVLDPCAGDGAILDVVARLQPGRLRFGFELDEDRAAACRAKGHPTTSRDSLTEDDWAVYTGSDVVSPPLIVTNPPFSLAMAFVTRSLGEVAWGGTVAMLLRLDWLGSVGRADFHKIAPANLQIMKRRPQFRRNKKGKKGSDSNEYAWFVWEPGGGGRWTILD